MISIVKKLKKRLFSTVLCFSFLITLCSCESNMNSTLNHSPKEIENNKKIEGSVDRNFGNDSKDLVIFSTNDTYAAYNDNLTCAGIKYYFDNFDTKENYMTLVDIGNFSSGNDAAKNSKGKSSIEIMNKMNYDLVVPGKHEFDYGIDVFFENMNALNADVVCCNMFDIKDSSLSFMPYVIYEYGNTKVAYIGVTSPEVMYNDDNYDMFFDKDGNQLFYFFEDETGDALYEQVQAAIDAAKEEGADKVVLLSHLGIENVPSIWSSTAVIAHTVGLDGVIDGGSMEVLESGLMTNKAGAFVPLVQAGTHLSNIGVMNITRDGYNFPAILSEKSIVKKDTSFQEFIDEVINKYKN